MSEAKKRPSESTEGSSQQKSKKSKSKSKSASKQKLPTRSEAKGTDLFATSDDRFVLFPIQSQAIWDFYKKAQRCFWTAEEVDLTADANQFQNKLSDNERHYVKHVLGFFASSDGIVNENLVLNIASKITLPEARCFYMFQMAIENVHAEMYSLMIDALIPEREDREHLFNAINTIPCIRKKADWALRYLQIENGNFAQLLVAFAAVEGIFFSASFCAIFWLKKRGLMPGLCTANELIRRDEGFHTDFACLLAKDMIVTSGGSANSSTVDVEQVYKIIKEAVSYEQEFVTDALPVSLIGMNADLMCRYVEFVADRLLLALGCEKVWNTVNPFEWMEMSSLQVKNNIHERVSTEYSKSLVDTRVRLDGELD